MTTITIEIPDEFAAQFNPTRLPSLLRDLVLRQSGKAAGVIEANDRADDVTITAPPPIYREITDFLSHSPTAAQIVAFKISPTAQERLEFLLDKNREESLLAQERAELDTYLRLSEWVSILKARARGGSSVFG